MELRYDCGLLLVSRKEMVQKLNRERQVSLDEPFLASFFLALSYLESYFKGVKGRRGNEREISPCFRGYCKSGGSSSLNLSLFFSLV